MCVRALTRHLRHTRILRVPGVAAVQNVAFMNLATNEASTDRDPAATPFCQCKKELSASGPGSRNGVDYGRYPIQRGWSQFPASCVDGACKCFDAGAAS